MIFWACSNTSDKDPIPTTSPINLNSILDKSARMMSDLNAFSFSLEHENGMGTTFNDLLLVTAEVKVEKPDSIDIKADILLGTLPFQTRIISKNQLSFIQNPLTEKWENMEQSVNPLAYFDPDAGIKAILSDISNLSQSSQSTKNQYEIRGEISAKLLNPFVGTTLNDQVSIKLLINRESSYLDAVHIYGRLQPADSSEIVRKITIYDHNEPASIKLPEQN